jgi:ketol-acid reductoisomerase
VAHDKKRCLKGGPLAAENNIIIMGFGNQAKAWAANLYDSHWKVSVLLRNESTSRAKIPSHYKCLDWQSPLSGAPIALLVPDHEITGALSHIAEYIPSGTTLFYAHGFAVIQDKLWEKFPQFHHVLLAPKAIGTEVRATFLEKRALGGVYSLEKVEVSEQEKIKTLTLKVSSALGINMGPYPCTVEQEMVADLFSEQAVLCSLIPESCRMAFEILREKGIPPELAFFELWHEVGLIVKTMVDRGPEAFFNLISPNALIGAEKGRKLLCDEGLEKKMRSLLNDIESGAFAKEASECDIEQVRSETLGRWKNHELNVTMKKMMIKE